MMRIYLIRHGESLGNIDRTNYEKILDHHVPLSEMGYEQALWAGKTLKEAYGHASSHRLRILHSPFKRAKQTAQGVMQGLGKELVSNIKEHFLLQEQDFGLFNTIANPKDQQKLYPREYARFIKQREQEGKVYARPPLGERRVEVAQRALTFKNSVIDLGNMHDDEDLIVVGHGVFNRALEMVLTGKSLNWFEQSANIGNADIIVLEGDKETGFKAVGMHESKKRTPLTPKDYKTQPYGSDQKEQAHSR